MEGCIVVGETVCGLFNTIVVMSVAGVQGKFESKPILQIFESGSQTCSHTQDTYICSFLNLFCLQGRGCQEVLPCMKIQSTYQNIFVFRLSRWIYNQNMFIKYSFQGKVVLDRSLKLFSQYSSNYDSGRIHEIRKCPFLFKWWNLLQNFNNLKKTLAISKRSAETEVTFSSSHKAG